jgi:hypothetical protein
MAGRQHLSSRRVHMTEGSIQANPTTQIVNFTTHKLNIGMILSSPSVVAVRLYACQTLGLTKLLLCF